MGFAGLLGTVKQSRRRSSAASGSQRPSSSSSAKTTQSSKSDRLEDGQAVVDAEKDNDNPHAASIRPNRSTHSASPSDVSSSFSDVSAGRPPPPDFIADESHLAPLPPEAPDLRELNNSLEALGVVFPDVQIDVFREMLTSFDGESRLALVADALLKSRATWVKGRWRIADKDKANNDNKNDIKDKSSSSPKTTPETSIPTVDRFRTPEYQKAAKALASHEFMGLSRSTINAVLAEQNYAYLEARRALVHMSSKSWRFALSSLFLRRKPVTCTEAENHPLIAWKSTGQGSIIPTIKPTGSAELDRELYDALISPLRAQQRATQEDADRIVASALNTEEAEAADATYECTCCFTTVTFEELVTCSNGDAAHVVCFRCVQHSVREAVFGQGWARTIDPSRGTLRCPAVDSKDCDGVIPVDHLHRALLNEKRGGDTLLHLERRLADHSLLGSGLPLVRCPFCEYAEVDDIYVLFHEAPLHLRVDTLCSLAFILFLFGATPILVFPFLVLIVMATLLPGFMALLSYMSSFLSVWRTSNNSRTGTSEIKPPRRRRQRQQGYFREQLSAAITRFRRRRRGNQFRCQNPACARLSCLSCGKAWTDIHVCHESSLVALRTQVEQAMSMAIKRVCPRCHTSFVKTVGCNKLTCPCGYKMCYVCRKDISGNDGPDAGYRHFCGHFRPHGDGSACTQCRKCNLWESEDTEAVLQVAREEAERKWRETERRELSLSERAYLETGIAIGGGSGGGNSGSSINASPRRSGGGRGPAGSLAARWLLASPISWALTGKGGGGRTSDGVDGGDNTSGTHLIPTLAEILDWLLESVLV